MTITQTNTFYGNELLPGHNKFMYTKYQLRFRVKYRVLYNIECIVK